MRRLALLGATLLGLSGTAHAQPPGHALREAASALSIPTALCPAGVPTQTITVVNQANVRPFALAKVENAVVAQSLQLRAAWGTPCVVFGAGGWPVQLLIGATTHGLHYYGPLLQVWTGGYDYKAWSEDFSHEIVEALVDPTSARGYYDPAHGAAGTMFGPVEVADPVDELGYTVDGVGVADFVTPAYFAGALAMPPLGCDPANGVPCGAPLAAADSAGPYDRQGMLTAPWSTAWER